jgi:hypothetical protein
MLGPPHLSYWTYCLNHHPRELKYTTSCPSVSSTALFHTCAKSVEPFRLLISQGCTKVRISHCEGCSIGWKLTQAILSTEMFDVIGVMLQTYNSFNHKLEQNLQIIWIHLDRNLWESWMNSELLKRSLLKRYIHIHIKGPHGTRSFRLRKVRDGFDHFGSYVCSISTSGCFQDLDPWPHGHKITTLPLRQAPLHIPIYIWC